VIVFAENLRRMFGTPNPASELAKRGHELRRMRHQERVKSVMHQLCAEIGKPVPEVFQ
jgi:hypothetical protein